METESDIPSDPYSVAQGCAAYLAHLEAEGRVASAVQDAKYKVDRYILPTLGRLQVSALQAKGLRQWRDDLAKPNTRAKRATANRIWTTLRAALNLAFQREEVSSDNAWRRVKPFKGVEAARLRYLTIPEVKLLVEACPPDFRLLVEAALQTGARYSELTRLMPADFNADAGTLHIRHSKSGKARYIILSDEGRALFTRVELPLRKSDGKPWGRSDPVRRMADAVTAAGIE